MPYKVTEEAPLVQPPDDAAPGAPAKMDSESGDEPEAESDQSSDRTAVRPPASRVCWPCGVWSEDSRAFPSGGPCCRPPGKDNATFSGPSKGTYVHSEQGRPSLARKRRPAGPIVGAPCSTLRASPSSAPPPRRSPPPPFSRHIKSAKPELTRTRAAPSGLAAAVARAGAGTSRRAPTLRDGG